jgi:UDPglucose 6-dehydrogenase
VIVTEWPELRSEDWATLAGAMRRPLLLDGRNFLDPERARAAGFVYEGIGRGTRAEAGLLGEADRAAT